MDSNKFWELIDEARTIAGSWEEMYDPLVAKLSEYSDDEILRWGKIFNLYQDLSYKDRLWAAAYVINGGCSDDGFDYFRGWLTAQGKDVFMSALRDPDSLVEIEPEDGEGEFEEMLSVGAFAYFKKHNMDPDYDLYFGKLEALALPLEEITAIEAEITYAEKIDLDWSADESLLKEIVPKLCSFFEW